MFIMFDEMLCSFMTIFMSPKAYTTAKYATTKLIKMKWFWEIVATKAHFMVCWTILFAFDYLIFYICLIEIILEDI